MNIKEYINNVDRNEISKFETIASHWWDVEGEFKLLHCINPLRLSYIAQHSGGLFKKKVLDVGCGGGILAESMAREGAKVTGLDIGDNLLEVARLHAFKNGISINYIQKTVEDYAKQYNSIYDIVVCMEMLEHVPDPYSVVQACTNLVKPGGEVFFSTINRTIKSWLVAIVGAEYILRMIPRGTHNLKRFIRPAELIAWIDKTPLCEKHITGLQYNLFTSKFYLTPGLDVNYILHTHHNG